MKNTIQFGKDLANGVFLELLKWVGIVAILGCAFGTVANFFQWGVDNSDVSSWDRSGLRIYTDNLTGVQYVSDGNSLCVRVDAKGEPVLSRTTNE